MSFALEWIDKERDYTIEKFGQENDDRRTRAFSTESLTEDCAWWPEQINMYLHRAQVLGLDTPVGRQAAAKAAATAVMFLESVVRVYGTLPEPGVPSGEVT